MALRTQLWVEKAVLDGLTSCKKQKAKSKKQKAKSKKQKANGQLARGPLDAELKSLLIKTTHGGNASQSSLTGIFLYTKYLEGCELTTFR